MRLLIATDAFPPRCGGSGWSTFELARSLVGAGHDVRVVVPVAGPARRRDHEGIEVAGIPFRPPPIPFVRSFAREERLRARFAAALLDELRRRPVDVIHGQHLASGLAAVTAGTRARVPVVVTVRDYWPICYFTTWAGGHARCPDCGFAGMATCMREKAPRAWWAAIPMMPYMRSVVRARQRRLGAAAAVIAVSRFVADEAVRPIVGAARTHVIPNAIDVAAVERAVRSRPSAALPERFLLFAGKLNRLKGADLVLEVARRLGNGVPFVVAGEGADAPWLERRAAAEGLAVRFLPWIDNVELLRVMSRAEAVLVPSRWHEPLSRTVLEAMAAGAPVVASDRGGIHDQLEHGRTGLVLPLDPDRFARELSALLGNEERRNRIREAAREEVRRRFDSPVVRPAVETLYQRVARGGRAA